MYLGDGLLGFISFFWALLVKRKKNFQSYKKWKKKKDYHKKNK